MIKAILNHYKLGLFTRPISTMVFGLIVMMCSMPFASIWLEMAPPITHPHYEVFCWVAGGGFIWLTLAEFVDKSLEAQRQACWDWNDAVDKMTDEEILVKYTELGLDTKEALRKQLQKKLTD